MSSRRRCLPVGRRVEGRAFVFGEEVPSIVKACSSPTPHLRALSRVRSLLTREAANAIAVCLLLSKLDSCNSLLVGLPQTQIKRLQEVQNAAARVVVKQRKRDHINPTLRELNWLPVCDRILQKLLSVTYRPVPENLPLYLSELIPPYTPPRSLRSTSESFLAVPGPRTVKQSDMANEPSDILLFPNGMPCPGTSGRQTVKQSDVASEPSDILLFPSGMPCPGTSGRQTVKQSDVASEPSDVLLFPKWNALPWNIRETDCKTKRYGQRAFRYGALSQWNALPWNIRETDCKTKRYGQRAFRYTLRNGLPCPGTSGRQSILSFRSALKTHFFHSL